MSIADAFLADILAHPADDSLRLIFADWLDENGEPKRGAFLRVQIERAKRCPLGYSDAYPMDDVCAVWDALGERERELLGACWREWAPDLGCRGQEVCANLVAPNGRPSVTFRRGFAAEIVCPFEVWCGAECSVCRGARRHAWWDRETATMTWAHCGTCHGTGRLEGHGPRLVRAAPLEKVTLAEWRGETCRECYRGHVPTDRDDNTCEVCHVLYNSSTALAWARGERK